MPDHRQEEYSMSENANSTEAVDFDDWSDIVLDEGDVITDTTEESSDNQSAEGDSGESAGADQPGENTDTADAADSASAEEFTLKHLDETKTVMNETDSDSSYKGRAVSIINMLLSQCYQYSEFYDNKASRANWTPVSYLTDTIQMFDQSLLLGVIPYGLAAALYLDEDPLRANSWQQLYEEGLLNARRIPHGFEPIEDVYGYANPSSDARW